MDTSGVHKKIRGHGIGRGASAGAGRVRHYISKRDLGRADAAGCAGCVYCVCPRQRFFGPSGIFGPAGAAGGGGRAARRTGGADGGAFVRYLGRAGLVPFGRGPFQRRSLLLRACRGCQSHRRFRSGKIPFSAGRGAREVLFCSCCFSSRARPRNVLIYLGPFLPVRPHAFFLISTLARIPSVSPVPLRAASSPRELGA